MLNQTQNKEHRNKEIQKHLSIENRSIITIENQLIKFFQKQQDKCPQIKNPHISPNSSVNLNNGDKNHSHSW